MNRLRVAGGTGDPCQDPWLSIAVPAATQLRGRRAGPLLRRGGVIVWKPARLPLRFR